MPFGMQHASRHVGSQANLFVVSTCAIWGSLFKFSSITHNTHAMALASLSTVGVPLLPAGAAVDAPNADGETPLMMAAKEGHNGVLQALLRARADVRAKDVGGNTALHHVSWSTGVAALLEAGAELGATNEQGSTPLAAATQRGATKVAQALQAAAEQHHPKEQH